MGAGLGRASIIITAQSPSITCLGGSGDGETVRSDRDGLSEDLGFNSPGRLVDFVFGFQGRML